MQQQHKIIVPAKSPNDKRTYEAIVLPNKLKLLLIHDDEIAKSACAISVGVGSLFDRERSLGLAHFLQHMLFMGSTKFPSHNQYSSFMSTNSGYDNAYTSDKETNYYFQIKNSCLYEAVQRLTNFFTGALLQQDCIQKQSQAVHQEFVLWTNDDNCRKWQILRKLASPPYCRFNIGNTQTLRHKHVRQDLVGFYNQYYSSNIINAVICSNFPIQELKKNLLHLFQAIPNKQVKLPQLGEHFTKNQTGKLVRMQSIKDQVIMQFFWAVEYLEPKYKKHLTDYITHVLGHEGKNSLLSILKNKNYASELSAYDHSIISQTIIGMEIKLTQEGQEQYEQVYNIVMDFISALKSQKYIYEEIKEKKLIEFQFKEKKKVTDYVSQLASKMHKVPIEEVLNSSALFQEYDESSINRVLSQLNPFNVIVVYSSSQQLQDPTTQKYLGGKYKIENLPKRQKSKAVFGEFPKNPFIPIDTRLYQFDGKILTPTKIQQNIYFLPNSSFRVCKGGISLDIFSEQTAEFMQFYTSYLQLLLKQETYAAQTLGCSVDYDVVNGQIQINLFGFSDTVIKLIQLIANSIETVHHTQQSEILFTVALNNLIQTYENFYNKQADQIADETMTILLTKNIDTIQKFLQSFKAFQYKSFSQRISNFWKKNILRWVVVGNFKQENLKSIIKKAENKMRLTNNKVNVPASGCLKLGQNLIHEIKLESEQLSSSCGIVYYQAGPYSEQLYYKLQLLKNYVDQPFFNELRTQKQMAYSLGATIQNNHGVLGLKFILISSTRDPKNISDEIKEFVNNFYAKMTENLRAQDDKLFKQIKQSVFTKIKSPHNNLNALFQFVRKEINQKSFYFTRKEEAQIRKHIDPIKVQDLADVWQEMKGITLEIYVMSKAHQQVYEAYNIKSERIEEIKNKNQFWSDYFYP